MFSVGCLHFPGKQAEIPETRISTFTGLSSEVFNSRVRFLGGLLNEKDISEGDKKLLQSLLEAYAHIQEVSSSLYVTKAQNRELVRGLFNALDLFEKKYFSRQKAERKNQAEIISSFTGMQNEVLKLFQTGDYAGVVDRCLKLRMLFGADAINQGTGAIFAMALAEEGLLDEAIRIGLETARKLEKTPGRMSLRSSIIQWQLEQGQRKRALRLLERMTGIHNDQKAMLRSLKKDIASSCIKKLVPEVETIQDQPNQEIVISQPEISAPMATDNDFFITIDRLIEENRFDEAREILFRKRSETSSPDEIEAINQSRIELELTEKQYLKKLLKHAGNLLEQEKFKETLLCLNDIKSRHINNSSVMKLEQLAVAGLIKRERNSAAKLFLLAKRASDPLEKEKYLRLSYAKLEALVEQFPVSTMIEKVKSNLKSVLEELNKLGLSE
jgi:hypothetical protein